MPATSYRNTPSGGGRRLRKTGTEPENSRLTRRLLTQLGAALALLGLWLTLGQTMPGRVEGWRKTLGQLLTGSCDLWEACTQLGEDLTQGEDVVTSVGDWCVTVFLPTSLTEPQEDSTASAGDLPRV